MVAGSKVEALKAETRKLKRDLIIVMDEIGRASCRERV